MEGLLDVHRVRLAQRELWSDSWTYIEGEWLRENCGETVGYKFRTSG